MWVWSNILGQLEDQVVDMFCIIGKPRVGIMWYPPNYNLVFSPHETVDMFA